MVKRKLCSFIVFVFLFASLFMLTPIKAETVTNYNINEGSVIISSDGNYHIVGTGEQTNNTITVNAGVNAYITLENVNIKGNRSAFTIADGSTGNVTIELIGNNILLGSSGPGIRKHGGNSTVGTLTILGAGTLRAECLRIDGAGIGSETESDVRNITIQSGIITAKAGVFGAGIGGGGGGSCAHNIRISGGNITAIGGSIQGAGIGGGSDVEGMKGDAEGIIITGGNITAYSRSRGAGIGGGNGYGSDIQILGGTVKAYGETSGISIGGNMESDSTLLILVPIVDNLENPFTTNSPNRIVYENKTYTVYGNAILSTDLTIKKDEKLVIPEGATLLSDANLIIYGTIEGEERLEGSYEIITEVEEPEIETKPVVESTNEQTNNGVNTFDNSSKSLYIITLIGSGLCLAYRVITKYKRYNHI